MRASTRILAALLVAGLLAACSGGGASAGGRLSVVASFYPIEFVTARIGGDLVSVRDLTPPGAEPHDVELKPSDVRAIRTADVVLYLGGGFQPAVEEAVRSLPDRSRAVNLLEGLSLSSPPAGETEAGPSVDPHVWLSPPLMVRMAATIQVALLKRLKERGTAVAARARTLLDGFGALDTDFAAGLKTCARKEVFTSHAAFGYLASRYQLTQVAISGLSPEAEPSSKRLQEVAALARKDHATTIFFETLVSPRVSEAVARIAGISTAVLDPIEGLTADERSRGDDYISRMRANLAALRTALGCT